MTTPEEIGHALIAAVRSIVEDNDATDRAEAAERARLVAQGHRIVDGGQVGPWDDDDDRAPFRVTDAETGEVLWEAYATGEEYEAEANRHPEWYHCDHVWTTAHDAVTGDDGHEITHTAARDVLPPSIILNEGMGDLDTLRDWLRRVDAGPELDADLANPPRPRRAAAVRDRRTG